MSTKIETTAETGIGLDTSQAIRFFWKKMLKTAAEIEGEEADLRARVKRLAEQYDAEHRRDEPKRDFVECLMSGFGQFAAEWTARKEARKNKR
jgi:hypothetical protein